MGAVLVVMRSLSVAMSRTGKPRSWIELGGVPSFTTLAPKVDRVDLAILPFLDQSFQFLTQVFWHLRRSGRCDARLPRLVFAADREAPGLCGVRIRIEEAPLEPANWESPTGINWSGEPCRALRI